MPATAARIAALGSITNVMYVEYILSQLARQDSRLSVTLWPLKVEVY
jgi:hypothetical protein